MRLMRLVKKGAALMFLTVIPYTSTTGRESL
jgi:hypothetical protein